MPTISYREFRPGKWVRLEDGVIVRAATAEEVAAWKQDKAAPVHIWEDVVATTSRAPSGEVKVAQPPAAKAQAPAGPSSHKEAEQSTIWEDVVQRSKSSVKAASSSEPRPRPEGSARAEQTQIWQDVVKQAQKTAPETERQPAKQAPNPPDTAEAKPRPAGRPLPVPTFAPAKAAPSAAPPEKPQGEGTGARKAFAAEVAAPKLSTVRKTEEKAAQAKKTPDAKPAPRPVPPAKTESKPRRESAPAPQEVPAKPPARKAHATRATAKKPAARAAEKTKLAAKPAPAKEKPAPSSRSQATKDRLPGRLLDEIAEEESTPVTGPVEEETPRPTSHPPSEVEASPRKRTEPRPRSSAAAASRRTTGKGKAGAAPERPNQMYLWIVAGQTDDLIATVRTGLTRYQERFSHPAEVVLCHSVDLPTLEGARLPVDVREGKSLPPRNFWIGLK